MTRSVLGVVLVLIVLAVGARVAFLQLMPAEEGDAEPVYATAEVVRGDIRVVVEGVGNLNPIHLSDLRAAASGYVESVEIERGGRVEAGQLVATLVNEEIGYEVRQLEFDLKRARLELAELLDVPPEEVTRVDPNRGIEIRAPIGGRVTELRVQRGDRLTEGQLVARIVDDSRVIMIAELYPGEIVALKVGDIVWLRNPEYIYEGYVEGLVTDIDPTPVPKEDHFIHRVTIEAENPGLMRPGKEYLLTLKTERGDVHIPRPQRIDRFWQETVVRSPADGTVTDVHVKDMAPVGAGDTLLVLGGADTRRYIEQRQLDIEEMELELARKQEIRENLVVRSPISGTVAWVHVQPGMRVEEGQSIASVFDNSRMNLYIRVDELDVVYVEEGQEAEVLVDALPGRSWQAKVLRVDMMGRAEDGIAQYGVFLEVEDTRELKPGMTAVVRIHIDEKEDVLLVPVEAVFDHDGKAAVEVLTEEGPEVVEVELGLINDRVAEVLSGLEEGQVVITGKPIDRLESEEADLDNVPFAPGLEAPARQESVETIRKQIR